MKRLTVVFLVMLVAVLVAMGLTPAAGETDGGWLVLGPIAGGEELPDGEPGPFWVHSLAFVEWDPGVESAYELRIIANEWEDRHIGQATVSLSGGGIGLCSTRTDGGAWIDANTDSNVYADVSDDDFGGPEVGIDFCGTAYGMAVEIEGCKAELQFHGYLHSDYPAVTYMGPVTVDVELEKKAEYDGETYTPGTKAKVTIYTPAETIKINGPVFGDVFMDDCDFGG